MKKTFCILACCSLATPLVAQQDRPSLMERGAQMFLEGLLDEMESAVDGLSELMEEVGPALRSFVIEMGPKLRAVLDDVEDWSVYEPPEVLPNGDIIIRRKPNAPDREPPQFDNPQIDL